MVARGYGAMSLSRGEVSWANIFSIAKQQYSCEYKFGYYIEVTLYVCEVGFVIVHDDWKTWYLLFLNYNFIETFETRNLDTQTYFVPL